MSLRGARGRNEGLLRLFISNALTNFNFLIATWTIGTHITNVCAFPANVVRVRWCATETFPSSR